MYYRVNKSAEMIIVCDNVVRSHANTLQLLKCHCNCLWKRLSGRLI